MAAAGVAPVPKDVFTLLAERHEAPAWAFMSEVRNKTGYSGKIRTADALAMSLFPSRGLHLHGFEVKISRGDWLRELKAPEKAEEIAKACHFWWLVISDAAIVREGELPQPWGLLVRKGDKLVIGKHPTFNEHAVPPSYGFLGSVLRKFSASETAEAKIEAARREGRDRGWKEGIDHALRSSEDGRAQNQLEELRARVAEFEKVSGVQLGRYNLGNVAAAVSILANGYDSAVRNIKRFADDAEAIAKKARESADAVGAVSGAGND